MFPVIGQFLITSLKACFYCRFFVIIFSFLWRVVDFTMRTFRLGWGGSSFSADQIIVGDLERHTLLYCVKMVLVDLLKWPRLHWLTFVWAKDWILLSLWQIGALKACTHWSVISILFVCWGYSRGCVRCDHENLMTTQLVCTTPLQFSLLSQWKPLPFISHVSHCRSFLYWSIYDNVRWHLILFHDNIFSQVPH